jgi:hypothetical protein
MVISRLRNGTHYKDIGKYLENNTKNNAYFYSRAHIFDFKNDKTEEKYLDFEYIEKYLGNNYLFKSIDQPTKIFKASPREAFENELVDDNDDDMFNFLKDIQESPYSKLFNELLDFPIDISSDISFDSYEFPNDYKSYLENLFKSTSLRDIIKIQSDFQNKMNENKSLYKYFRGSNKNNKNIFLVENYRNYNFLEDKIFIKSDKKMTFLEFIDDSITIQTNNDEEKYYHRFSIGYNIINSMGLDGERNCKANFKNTFNDGLHAFYASYCDLFVSNDSGIKEKATLMYKLFNKKTKIIDPEKFIEIVNNEIL